MTCTYQYRGFPSDDNWSFAVGFKKASFPEVLFVRRLVSP